LLLAAQVLKSGPALLLTPLRVASLDHTKSYLHLVIQPLYVIHAFCSALQVSRLQADQRTNAATRAVKAADMRKAAAQVQALEQTKQAQVSVTHLI
jgi:hypothetical protein